MTSTRRSFLRATVVGATLAFAGCGGGSGERMTDADATVRVRSHGSYGDILVGPEGHTLYLFDKDETDQSNCTGGCAENWPPLTVEGEPTKTDRVSASLSTFEREDGSRQVAVAGHPLYYFAPDEQPGDAKGQGVNDVWWVVAPDGSAVTEAATETETDDGYY